MSRALEPIQSSDAHRLRNARRVTMRVKPDRIEEFLSVIQSDVHPVIRSHEGVRRIYLFQNPESENEFLSLTLWNTVRDSENAADDYVSKFASLGDLLEAPPTVAEFNVIHHEVSDEVPPPREAARKKPSKKTGTDSKSRSKRRQKKSKSRKRRS